MRLYLAVAVLMLAFVAYTEAQEETLEQKFTKFREQVAELGKTFADNTRDAFEQIRTSTTGASTTNWFQRCFEDIKARLGGNSQSTGFCL